MKLPVTILSDDQWFAILAKYGHGQVTRRFRYQKCDAADSRFQGHTVVHGRDTQTGGLTSTGFLQDHRREVIAGIDTIPIQLPTTRNSSHNSSRSHA